MLDGVWIPPPYVFAVRDRALWINGQLAIPAPPKASPLVSPTRGAGAGVTPQTQLLDRVYAGLRDSHAPSAQAKLDEALARVRKSRLVRQAYIGAAGSSMTIIWKGDGEHDGMTECVELGRLALSDAERARADSLTIEHRRWMWERAVNANNAMLLVGRHEEFLAESFDFQRVRAEIEALQQGDSTSDHRQILPGRMRDEILARARQRKAESMR